MLASPTRLLTPFLAALALAVLPGSAAAAPATVSVVDKAFTPANVAIAPGESVTWNWNADGHNVHVTQGPSTFDSGFKDAGATFTKAIAAEGTYRYICDAHPEMRGVITVGSGTAAPAPAAAASPSAPASPRVSAVAVAAHAVLWLRSARNGQVRTRIVRGRRVVRRATLTVSAGANHIPLDVRRLRVGRYRLVVVAGGRRIVRTLKVTRKAARRAPATASPAPAPATAPAPAPEPPPPGDDDGTPDRGGDDD